MENEQILKQKNSWLGILSIIVFIGIILVTVYLFKFLDPSLKGENSLPNGAIIMTNYIADCILGLIGIAIGSIGVIVHKKKYKTLLCKIGICLNVLPIAFVASMFIF